MYVRVGVREVECLDILAVESKVVNRLGVIASEPVPALYDAYPIAVVLVRLIHARNQRIIAGKAGGGNWRLFFGDCTYLSAPDEDRSDRMPSGLGRWIQHTAAGVLPHCVRRVRRAGGRRARRSMGAIVARATANFPPRPRQFRPHR